MKKQTYALLSILLISGLAFAPFGFSSATKSMIDQKLPPLITLQFLKKNPELKGKPLIVEFWATWCPPCRQSIPHLNEIYKKYKDKGLEIIGITNEEKDVVENFLTKLPIDYHVGLDEGSKFSSLFEIEGIPHAVVVDRSGKIIWEGHPMSLQESILDKVLAAK